MNRTGLREQTKTARFLLAIAVLAPLIRFAADAARGLDFLHFQYLVDDAFYYFVIARHVPYFNPGIATSGFHPLYAFVASAFHGALSANSAIVACLFVLAAANSACVWVLYRLLARLYPGPVPLLGCLGWAASSKIHALSMTGVEAILAVLGVLLFYDGFVARIERRDFGEVRAMAGLGLCAGVAFLARMDAPLLIGPAAIWVCLLALRAGRPAAAACFATFAVAPPLAWIAYILSQTGSVVPTSAAAIRVLRHAADPFLGSASGWVAMARLLRYGGEYLSLGGAASWLLVGLLAGGFGLYRWGRAIGRASFAPFATSLLAGFAVWSAYYAFYLGGFRIWYGLYLAIAIYALLLPMLAAGALAYTNDRTRKPAAIVAAAVVIGISLASRGGPIAPQEYDKYRAAVAADPHLQGLPDAARVGSFNSGVYNFYTRAEVINLDGVVNPAAMAAHRDGEIAVYMRKMNIRYLIEHEPSRAATFRRVFRDPSVRFEKWIDLSNAYPPYGNRVAKKTYLWKVTYPDDDR
jgi:hypothetical protein